MQKTFRLSPSRCLNIFLVVAVSLLLANGLAIQLSASGVQEAPPTERQEKREQENSKKFNKEYAQQQKSTEQKKSAEKKNPTKSADSTDATPSTDKGSSKAQEETGTGETSSPARPRRRRQSRSASNSRSSNSFLDVFRPIIADAALATVEIKKGSKTIALGTVVDPGGFVLTKQSELQSPLTCQLNDGRSVPAYVYGVHPDTDLALLKIEAENLPVVHWANSEDLDIGHWLATIKGTNQSVGVGVVGVKARVIRPQSGFMGVSLQQTERGVMISAVTPDSPAKDGGLKPGDIIQKVNGESFTEMGKLIVRVKSFPPGEKIRLTLIRDDREIIADVVLGEERSLNPLFERSNQQNTMGGNELSQRRQNFPLAVQHDTFLKPEECGGPVVNIDGKVVGINIARQGRVSSLMLPSSLVRNVINELKSGQWAPAVVYKERIQEINRTLQELNTEVALSPANGDSLKKKVRKLNNDEKKLREKLEKTLMERVRAEVELERASGSFASATKEIERLTTEREKLVTGTR